MANMKPQSKNELPPYKGELKIVKIVRSGDPVETEPLNYVIDFENARGDFNEFLPDTADFNKLASESGEQFFVLANR